MPVESIPPIEAFPVVRIAHIIANIDTPDWLITDLWSEQGVGFIGGTPKSCKTWLALEMAVAIASGQPCLGRFAVHNPGHVLLYTAEDSAAAVRRRISAIATARGVKLARLAVGLITEPTLQLDRPGDQHRLHATLEKLKPRMLLLDPLVRLHRGDENSASETSALLGFLRGLQREHEVAIGIVHHMRKGATGGQPGQALRGSGDLHAWSDSNLFMLHRNDGLELHAEHRNHPAPDPMAIKLATNPEHLVVADIGEKPHSNDVLDLQKQVLTAIAAGPTTRTALRQRLRIRNETLGEVLSSLEASATIHRVDGLLTVPRSHP